MSVVGDHDTNKLVQQVIPHNSKASNAYLACALQQEVGVLLVFQVHHARTPERKDLRVQPNAVDVLLRERFVLRPEPHPGDQRDELIDYG